MVTYPAVPCGQVMETLEVLDVIMHSPYASSQVKLSSCIILALFFSRGFPDWILAVTECWMCCYV